eukprot:gene606-251_t
MSEMDEMSAGGGDVDMTQEFEAGSAADDQFEFVDDSMSEGMSESFNMEDGMSMTDDQDVEFRSDGIERSNSFAVFGTVNNQVSIWSANWATREVDLLTELGASSLFFISADSLVLEFLMNGDAKLNEEQQVLHVHYLLELLLEKFAESGARRFRLIFFNGFKSLFDSEDITDVDNSAWLLRQAFLLHCRNQDFDIALFEHWLDDDWQDYLKQWAPSFMLLGDEKLALPVADSDDESVASSAMTGNRVHFSAIPFSLILETLAGKVHCALLHGFRQHGNRLYTVSLSPALCHPVVRQNAGRIARKEIELNEEDEDSLTDEQYVQAMIAFRQKIKSSSIPGDIQNRLGLRSFVMITALNRILDQPMDPQGKEFLNLFAKVMILHDVMLQHVPLQHRSLATFQKCDWGFLADGACGSLLSQHYFEICASVLGKIVPVKESSAKNDTFVDAHDFFDSRMFRFLMYTVVKNAKGAACGEDYFGFEKSVTATINFLWDQTREDKNCGFWPIEVSNIGDLFGDIPDEKLLPKPQKVMKSPAITQLKETEVFDRLMKNEDLDKFLDQDAKKPAFKYDVNPPERFEDVCFTEEGWQKNITIDSVKLETAVDSDEEAKAYKMRPGMSAKQKERWLARQKKWQQTRKQKLANHQAAYAKSLTGASGLHKPIIMDLKEVKEDKKDEKISAKKQEILEKSMKAQHEKNVEKDKNQYKGWEERMSEIAEAPNANRLFTMILDLLAGKTRVTDAATGFPKLMQSFQLTEYQIKTMMKLFKSIKSALKSIRADMQTGPTMDAKLRRPVLLFFRCVIEFFQKFKADLDPKSAKTCQEYVASVGFPRVAKKMYAQWCEAQASEVEKMIEMAKNDKSKDKKDKSKGNKKDDKKKDDKKDKKSKKDSKDKDDKGSSERPDNLEDLDDWCKDGKFKKLKDDLLYDGVKDREAFFQLLYMGPDMERTTGTRKDEKNRVRFKPDAWQIDLLDTVDDNKSALVVAPTASGKTFICFYAMERVLRQDNTSVAVYVAPSKALVNQVSAEVYARFSSKNYGTYSGGIELAGVFLREYQTNALNCQVLVTVPHVLELLMTCPAQQEWAKRVKYIVFDEVHCIGESQGGEQWEHLLQIIPCPFIALSATVGNPADFHGFLQRVRGLKFPGGEHEVNFVQHRERWNDLYKYIYSAEDAKMFPLHPYACLNYLEVLTTEIGIATDCVLTPREGVRFWFYLDHFLKGQNSDWTALEPEAYFHESPVLTKFFFMQWQNKMREVFVKMVKNGTIPENIFRECIDRLRQPAPLTDAGDFDEALDAKQRVVVPEPDADKMIVSNAQGSHLVSEKLMVLLKQLDQHQQMPARPEIDKMLSSLVELLGKKQWNKYHGTPEADKETKNVNKKREQEYQKALKRFEAMQKMKTNDENYDEVLASEEPIPPVDVDDEVDPEFSFIGVKALGTNQDEIAELIERCEKHPSVSQALVEGLQRGIGAHSDGHNKIYRQTVEVLFRLGYLRVVISTQTLALGINMPCRSTIFCGDTLRLTGLMYRQMSGRAGRRGFDLLGHVIFFDLPSAKVNQLVASALPNLSGELSMSCSWALRALMLWESIDGSEKDLAFQKLAPSLKEYFFYKGSTLGRHQMLLFFRYSLEFLFRNKLLSQKGKLDRLASATAAMFEDEPSNFVFNRLFLTGALHTFLKEAEKNEKSTDKTSFVTYQLARVMGHFMQRRMVYRRAAEGRKVNRKKHMPSASFPCLQDLPAPIQKELDSYNNETFEVFTNFVKSCSLLSKDFTNEDFELPKSSISIIRDFPNGDPFKEDSQFMAEYRGHLNKFRCRSPFQALPGRGDKFKSAYDLVDGLRRSQVRLDIDSMPSLLPRKGDGTMKTDSWLCDFLMHGKLMYLRRDNLLVGAEAWTAVHDVVESLRLLKSVLSKIAGPEDIVLTSVTLLQKELKTRLAAESA